MVMHTKRNFHGAAEFVSAPTVGRLALRGSGPHLPDPQTREVEQRSLPSKAFWCVD